MIGALAGASGAHKYVVRKPSVFQIQKSHSITYRNTTVGVLALFALPSADWPLLASGSQLQEPLTRYRTRLPRVSPFSWLSGAPTFSPAPLKDRVDLQYDGSTLLSAPLDCLLRKDGFQVPFLGGTLAEERYSIIDYSKSAETSNLRFALTVQLPQMSEFEVSITSKVPGNVDEVYFDTAARIARSGIPGTLLAMDGGWAVGGIIARRAIARMKRRHAACDRV